MTAPATLGKGLTSKGWANSTRIREISAAFNGSGSAISAASKVYNIVPYDCTVVGWEMFCDTSTTSTVDVWAIALASAPPTVSNTITGSTLPTLTTATQASDFVLTPVTGWLSTAAKFITAGTAVIINLTSNNNATLLRFSLIVVTGD